MIAAYLALACAVVMILQSLLYRRFGLKKLSYSRQYTPNTVFEGETVTMTEKITNAKILPMAWLRIESMLSPNLKYVQARKGENGEKNIVYGEHNSVFSVPPYTTVTRRYTMLCEARGYYDLKAVNFTAQDIFGMGVQHAAEADIATAVTVYPRIATYEELGDLSKNLMGDVIVRRWISEDPFMLRGTREYQTSDPMSKINWKASARTGGLMVNELDTTADIKLQIYFNVQADRYFTNDVDPECIERGISAAAAFLQFAAEHGIQAAFAANSVDSPLGETRTGFGTGHGHLGEVFTQLAALSRRSKEVFGKFLTQEAADGPEDCGILVMTAYTNDTILEACEMLRERGNLVALYSLERTPGTHISEEDETL